MVFRSSGALQMKRATRFFERKPDLADSKNVVAKSVSEAICDRLVTKLVYNENEKLAKKYNETTERAWLNIDKTTAINDDQLKAFKTYTTNKLKEDLNQQKNLEPQVFVDVAEQLINQAALNIELAR